MRNAVGCTNFNHQICHFSNTRQFYHQPPPQIYATKTIRELELKSGRAILLYLAEKQEKTESELIRLLNKI